MDVIINISPSCITSSYPPNNTSNNQETGGLPAYYVRNMKYDAWLMLVGMIADSSEPSDQTSFVILLNHPTRCQSRQRPANDGRPGQSTKHSTQTDHVRGLASGHWDSWWAAVLTWSAASQDVKAGQV